MPMWLYIASQDREGAILQCVLNGDGVLREVGRYPLDRPAWLCAEGRRLYALLREPFMMQSGIASFDILADGSLRPDGDIQPTHGTLSAHALAAGGRLYCANYLGGTVTLLPGKVAAYSGRGPNPERQDCSHPHCLTLTPDGKYLCVNDLGTDRIYVCTPRLEEVSRAGVPAGSGPRHLVFSKDGRFAYSSNELIPSVSVFRYGDGRLDYVRSYSTLLDGFAGTCHGKAIRLSADGERLYLSNSGQDSVAEFAVEGERLTLLRHIPSGGRSPREIVLAGDWLLCANEDSDTICVYPLKEPSDRPASVFEVKRPWCILPLSL